MWRIVSRWLPLKNKRSELKKALKIISRLEKTTANSKSNILIAKSGEKIIYANKENHFLIQIIHLAVIVTPLIIVCFQRNELNLFACSVLIFCSTISFFSYVKGSFQTKSNIEINIANGEIRINRIGFFGKPILKDKVIKTETSNELLKENIPFSDTLEKRLTLKNKDNKIPVFDLRNDSDFNQIHLSLKLLVKGQ